MCVCKDACWVCIREREIVRLALSVGVFNIKTSSGMPKTSNRSLVSGCKKEGQLLLRRLKRNNILQTNEPTVANHEMQMMAPL